MFISVQSYATFNGVGDVRKQAPAFLTGGRERQWRPYAAPHRYSFQFCIIFLLFLYPAQLSLFWSNAVVWSFKSSSSSWIYCHDGLHTLLCCHCESPLEFDWALDRRQIVCNRMNQTPLLPWTAHALVLQSQLQDELHNWTMKVPRWNM